MQIGGFAIASEKIGKLNLSGGIRYDTRTFTGEEHWVSTDTLTHYNSGSAPILRIHFRSLTNLQVYLVVCQEVLEEHMIFTKNIYAKANIARGWRAPNVNECAADGVHDGTVVFEIGDQ